MHLSDHYDKSKFRIKRKNFNRKPTPPKLLASCPFCGGKAELKRIEASITGEQVKVSCRKCYCGTSPIYVNSTYITGERYTLREAIKITVSRWNSRPEMKKAHGFFHKFGISKT